MKSNNLKNWSGVAAVIGVDWGDSGKGRLIDDLGQRAAVVARFNGGSNTGHTIKNEFGTFALHIMPSGIFNPKTKCLVGKNVLVDLESLIDDELEQLRAAGVSWKNLRIDHRATLVMPWHKLRDALREQMRSSKLGTLKRGVGPAYADRTERVGLRVKDLVSADFAKKLKEELTVQNKFFNLKLSYREIHQKFTDYAKIIKPYVADTNEILNEAIKNKQNVLFEGAQGYFLDIDAGTYPYVTSSNPGLVGILRSFDLNPSVINHPIGITKAYTTRVGAGPMPTIIKGKERKIIIEKGGEVGTTSGRVRDPGWLDLVLLKAACEVNNIKHLAVTKLDILTEFDEIKICIGYLLNGKKVGYIPGDADKLEKCKPVYQTLPGWQEDITKVRKFADLPKNAKKYIQKIEEFVGVPVDFIGVGPARNEVIYG
ncbi:MAG: adenylosuccinate synthase [Candidatus Curtissbacteria bacterium]|nr:adenylosuccinate synthase [Candidatus Curtissbacteria bacterium]